MKLTLKLLSFDYLALLIISKHGSGALNGKMLDLEYFFLFLAPAEPYPNQFHNPAGQS